MYNSILISIKRPYTDWIYAGIKTIEIRKQQPFKDKPVKMPFRCYIYETSTSGGTGMVTGYFECKTVLATNYYEGLVKGSCLSLEQLIDYADDKVLSGMLIGKVVKFKEPMPVSYFGFKRPPQSWQYIYFNPSICLLEAAVTKYKLRNIDGMTCLDVIDKIQNSIA